MPTINLDEPRYDQSIYLNRVKHFFLLTNPLHVFASNSELEKAARIIQNYRINAPLSEAKSIDELWKAKYLYDSAYHPQTGEKMILIGRMSAQVSINMVITGCMMTFYKTTPAVIFWQWLNQSLNAVVNYTNRSGSPSISKQQLFTSYCMATGGALATALTLNRLVKNSSPLVGRFVPFAAVVAANCINIPLMRFQELTDGVTLLDENGDELGHSIVAGRNGIAAVTFSRICMACPGMTLTPILSNYLDRKGLFKRLPWINAPIQTLIYGICLAFALPLGCAMFSQKTSIKVSSLEKDVQESIHKRNPDIEVVYFNKGL